MAGIYLSQFATVLPPIYMRQDQTLEWLIKRHMTHSPNDHASTLEKLFRRYGVKAEQISGRYVSSQDMADVTKEDHELELFSERNVSDIYPKTQFYKNYFLKVFQELYPRRELLPPHLIHVTCTGYVAPSAAQRVVSAFHGETKVTHAYHMGCYAAMPAIRIAQGLVKGEDSPSVDIVHTEACSIHMDPTDHSPEAMVIQTLFADGNIKYTVSSTPCDACFELLHVQEMLVPDSADDMSWELKKWGFAMTLSRDVPAKIPQALPRFFDRLVTASGLGAEALLQKALFAVHPGGPRIIEAVSKELGLEEWQISASKQVLRTRGNMSSATLPHVWQEMMQQDPADGTLVVSLAFGPGLTMFGSLFRWHRGKAH